ncbi:MAG: exonuclease SbcCD subunit D [Clostridia bacterium]|nr:exonuclease SbcCD subunit D [Clostridia bacterium]
MRFIHVADLHIGKKVNEFSMIADQTYILNEILKITEEYKADAVIIAGDIYDKTVPPLDAVQLFDSFLTRLMQMNVYVFAVSGNHDSAERISFGASIMKKSNVFVSPIYKGASEPVKLHDEYGYINVYLLPFIKPIHVRNAYPDAEIHTYDDAVKYAVDKMNTDVSERNIIVAHQFVTGAQRCESEELSIGGLDDIDYKTFEKFDYAALGHIHGAQHCGVPHVRYSGTPLKYSFSECCHKKSVTVVDVKEKGNVEISTVPLKALHDMREIKGTYMEITDRRNYIGTDTDDYMHITLTDEEDIPDAIGKLRAIYKNIMRLDYDNIRTRSFSEVGTARITKEKTPVDLFSDLYEMQNNQSLCEEQRKLLEEIIERTEGKSK